MTKGVTRLASHNSKTHDNVFTMYKNFGARDCSNKSFIMASGKSPRLKMNQTTIVTGKRTSRPGKKIPKINIIRR